MGLSSESAKRPKVSNSLVDTLEGVCHFLPSEVSRFLSLLVISRKVMESFLSWALTSHNPSPCPEGLCDWPYPVASSFWIQHQKNLPVVYPLTIKLKLSTLTNVGDQ